MEKQSNISKREAELIKEVNRFKEQSEAYKKEMIHAQKQLKPTLDELARDKKAATYYEHLYHKSMDAIDKGEQVIRMLEQGNKIKLKALKALTAIMKHGQNNNDLE